MNEHTHNLTLRRTNSENVDFINLVSHLDTDLRNRYGEQQAFFSQFNKLDSIKNVVVVYVGEIPVGCAAFKKYDTSSVEIKRMFVANEHRGKGIAGQILNELETWATELHYQKCVLETGTGQPEAIGLYYKCGYKAIPNYGQYIDVENSLCMEKVLI